MVACTLYLCEVDSAPLVVGRLYTFIVDDECSRCRAKVATATMAGLSEKVVG